MTRTMWWLAASLTLPLAWGAACGDTESTSANDDDGSGANGGAGPASTGCQDYIDCVTAVSPALLADVLAAYGTSGSCWQNLPVQQCLQACIDGEIMLHDAYPDEPACGAPMGAGGQGGQVSSCLEPRPGCESCGAYINSCLNGTCFDANELCGWDNATQGCCPGDNSCAKYDAMFQCACDNGCMNGCPFTCTGTGTDDANCGSCIQNSFFGVCSGQFNTCSADQG